MTARDRGIAAALAVLVIVTRLPFATRVLFEWDSVLYARALEQGFQVSAGFGDQRPHPPGYIFYVAAAAILRTIFGDSNAALVAVSILASAGAVVAVYLLARRFARPELAAFAALAFAVDPLVWAHGEIALPYIVLALGATGLALLFWDARQGGRGRLIVASLTFGLAAGFRQDLLLLLGPLWVWCAVRHGWRATAFGAACVGAASFAWLAPSVLLSGGPGAYLAAIVAQSGSITGQSVLSPAGAGALSYNVRFTVLALAWGLFATGAVLAVLLLTSALHWMQHSRRVRVEALGAFFLLWIGPGVLLYVFWIIGDWGYVLSILPALYVLCAALLERAFSRAPGRIAAGWRLAGSAVVIATAAAFLVGGGRWSEQLLARHDRDTTARVAYIRGHFAADRSLILAREDYQQARYYLNGYRVWLYDPAAAGTSDRKKEALQTTLVIFTPGLALRQPAATQRTNIDGEGDLLIYVPVPASAAVQLFGVDPIAREP